MTALKPRPLVNVMDQFVARAIIAFRVRVEALSAMDALVYSGDDWPQPHPSLGMKRLPWEDWPTRESLIALRDRLRAMPTDPS